MVNNVPLGTDTSDASAALGHDNEMAAGVCEFTSANQNEDVNEISLALNSIVGGSSKVTVFTIHRKTLARYMYFLN